MDTAEIRSELTALDAELSAKGWRTPSCEFNMDRTFWIYVKAKHPLDGGDSISEFCDGEEGPEEAIVAARKFIRSLPTGEDAARDDFRKSLGKLIDKGKALGIDADFLNPLTEQMRALSENILPNN